MKYTILGFNQLIAVELGIDTTDLFILRYFIDFRDTKSMICKIIDDTPYYWFQYEAFNEEYPILGLKKDTVYRRMKKLSDKGILKHKTVINAGKYSFYTISENYYKLLSESNPNHTESNPNHTESNPNHTESNPIPYGFKSRTKYPSTNNPSTNNNNNIMSGCEEEVKNDNVDNVDKLPVEEIVDYLNEKANTSFRSTSNKTRTLIRARFKEGFTIDDFKKVIDNKVISWINDANMRKYLRPETLFGTKFESYLNEKPVLKADNSKNKFNNFDARDIDYNKLEDDLTYNPPIEDEKPKKGISLDKFYSTYSKKKNENSDF